MEKKRKIKCGRSFVREIGCVEEKVRCDVRLRGRFFYSTVTDLARFLGKSTSTPWRTAKW